MRKSKKPEDLNYLKQFENKTTSEMLDILTKEAESLKQLIKSLFNKENK